MWWWHIFLKRSSQIFLCTLKKPCGRDYGVSFLHITFVFLTVGLPEIWNILEIQKMKICSEVRNFMGKMNFQSKCAEVSWLLRFQKGSNFWKTLIQQLTYKQNSVWLVFELYNFPRNFFNFRLLSKFSFFGFPKFFKFLEQLLLSSAKELQLAMSF